MARSDYVGKEDIRIIKSKRDLRNALMKLLEEKAFSSISVIDICKVAMINRMTFYKHYEDKYDLLKDCLKEVGKKVFNKTHEMFAVDSGNKSFIDSYMAYLKTTIDVAEEYRGMLNALIVGNEPLATSMVVEIIGSGVNKLINYCMQNKDLMVSKEVTYSFILGAYTNIMFSWIKHPNGKTKQELYNEMAIISGNIINAQGGILFKVRK